MKHLVIDARCALPQTDGLGTYIREIVPTIVRAGYESQRYRSSLLIAPSEVEFWARATPSARAIVSAIRPMRPPQNWQIDRLLRDLGADLYFYPAHDPPMYLRVPFVFTIHDVTPFRVRPYFETYDRPKRAYLGLVIRTGLHRARAVLAVSETTRLEIGRCFGDGFLSKITATPNGIAQDVILSADDSGEAALRDIALYVGTDRPHKNLLRVISAYARARRADPSLGPLHVVGGIRTRSVLEAAIAEHGVRDAVELRGHVSNAELEATYRRAEMLVFPSLSEGFGLPILEAMKRGVPVVTSSISACAEVAADAALVVDPYDVGAICAALLRIHREPALRASLIDRGLARAKEFAWARTAMQTVDVLMRVLGETS